MKKTICLFLMFLFLFSTPVLASSNNSTSTSYSYTRNTLDKMTISKDAYRPTGTFLGLELDSAQDMDIRNDIMYIADKGNSVIKVVDLQTNEVKIIGEGILDSPTGVSADKNGNIYVADSGNSEAYIFDKNGELKTTFTKPTTPNFGKKQVFKPLKIVPTDDNGAYIISEGNNAGIVQLNGLGDFLGYFASNNINLSITGKIMNAVLTDTQKSSFLKVTPSTYSQIFRGEDGLVYTLNMGSNSFVKKHAISGRDMLEDSQADRWYVNDAEDIFVDSSGRIYILERTGIIDVLNSDGELICRFGGNVGINETSGLFKNPAGIACDEKGNIYVLDSARNYIQIFSPTENQLNIYNAIDKYNNGEYEESKNILSSLLKFDNTSYIGHYFYGKNLLQQGEYALALTEFKISNSKELYSQSFWEVRNQWLQNNLGAFVGILIILYLLYIAIKIILKRTKFFNGFVNVKNYLLKYRIYQDLTKLKYALFHPMDSAYEIKVGNTGTYKSSVILYFLLYLIYIGGSVASGYIFSVNLYEFSIVYTTLYFVGGISLFIFANYYISELLEGNGTIKSITLSIVYGFAPVILFMPFVIIISNFSTFNEAFLINGLTVFLISWSVINIVLSLIEIHEYSFKDVVKCLILTFITMAVIVLFLSIVYLLFIQVIDFVSSIITEVFVNV